MGDEVRKPAGKPNGSPYADPALQCDIVMKGGITSGVVYPFAVTQLAKRYRFRSIGGTSAGAIAAAVTAAAEHNRGGGGFERVAELPEDLGSAPGGKPFTLQLFTPDKKTRKLFEAGVGFMRWGKVRGFLYLFRWLPRALVPPVVLLLAAILVCIFADVSAVWAVLAGFAAVLLAILGLVTEGLLAVRTLAKNDFGICHLGPGAGTSKAPALTPWLHHKIQQAAGRRDCDPPLTFADLWGVPHLPKHPTDADLKTRNEILATLSRHPRLRAIDLQVMTTSLSHGRPMRLPVPIQKHHFELEEGSELLFKPKEMRRLFPERVVKHLEDLSDATYLSDKPTPEGFRRFPIGPELPVIVATRMSLSFPILITAVSLWEHDRAAGKKAPPLKRVVFSDGGITSNFPIHFFDSPVPTRPTFGLQLTGFEAGDGPKKGDPAHSVEDPPSGREERVRELRSDMHDMRGFLTALKDAMQNWRDNTQSQLPGYRERIERIKMGRKEGGLNLTMDEKKIAQLTSYGELAGRRLVTLFSGSPCGEPIATDHSETHRFARYRVTMSVLERFLQDFAYGYETESALGAPYEELIEEHTQAEPYKFGSADRRDAAFARSEVYRAMSRVSPGKSLDDAEVPRPPATLRSVPPT